MADLSPSQVSTTLVVLKFVTVVAGAYMSFLAFRAYRRTRQNHLLVLAVGMLILCLGAISEGLAYQALGWTLDQSHILEAVVTLVGFLVLVYSVVVK